VTYNAPIRLAAGFQYESSSKRPSDLKLRDESIHLALACFDELSQSKLHGRNSATYAYLLEVVAKYFPASRIRGNMAHGMFHHARLQGLIDAIVLNAHRAANSPSNGPEFDAFYASKLEGRALKELPDKWRRYARAKRHHPREATY